MDMMHNHWAIYYYRSLYTSTEQVLLINKSTAVIKVGVPFIGLGRPIPREAYRL